MADRLKLRAAWHGSSECEADAAETRFPAAIVALDVDGIAFIH